MARIAMPALPVTRKKKPPQAKTESNSAKKFLAEAFATFTHAAGSLEKSYSQLQSEVLRLRFDLERTNRDLSQSLEENARMREYLGRILESLPCGVLVLDRDLNVQIANSVSRQFLAVTDNELHEGGPLIQSHLRLLLQELRELDAGAEREWQQESVEGIRSIALSCAILGADSGVGSESVFILRDTTEQKRLAEERESIRRRESLAEMATILAHEIRNPLGSLELFAGLLADAAATQPDLRRWTDHIQAGLRTLAATVNNVLQFHNHTQPVLIPVNLGRVLRESVEFLRPLARQSSLRIDLINSLGEIEIPADFTGLQQVFLNLALNAFRSMQANGVLTIRLRRAGSATAGCGQPAVVQVDFEDQGIGISPENLQKILTPGFSTHRGNPGLGLAVCRKVMDQHGGEIQVRSELKAGTTFSLLFPIAEDCR